MQRDRSDTVTRPASGPWDRSFRVYRDRGGSPVVIIDSDTGAAWDIITHDHPGSWDEPVDVTASRLCSGSPRALARWINARQEAGADDVIRPEHGRRSEVVHRVKGGES